MGSKLGQKIIDKIRNKEKSTKRKKERWYEKCYQTFIQLDSNSRFKIIKEDFCKHLDDNTQNTGFETHYLYHPAWAIRKILKIKPEKHVDISSAIKFCADLSAYLPVEFYDYRPANIILSDLTCNSADLTQLHFENNNIECLSCMHTVEHVGLGRYGDEIDPEGDLSAINELKRVLKKGGHLLFVVPISSQPRIEYNAHRIYSHEMILEYFKELELVEFSIIPDNAAEVGIIENPNENILSKQLHACGLYCFRKSGC